MPPITGVNLCLLVRFIPTASMTIASVLLSSISVYGLVEASFQNFATGLILAAVASELFPLMVGEGVSQASSMIGITVGFFVGLVILNRVETCVEYTGKEPQVGSTHSASERRLSSSNAGHKKSDIPFCLEGNQV